MRFPAVYQRQVESYLQGLLWNLPPVKGPEMEVVFRPAMQDGSLQLAAVWLGEDDEQPPLLSGAEVSDDA